VSQLNKVQKVLQDSITVAPSHMARYFKTGPGDYAEHEVFIGVTVANVRKIAKQFATLSFDDLRQMLLSKIN
jgi:hypothetical protein